MQKSFDKLKEIYVTKMESQLEEKISAEKESISKIKNADNIALFIKRFVKTQNTLFNDKELLKSNFAEIIQTYLNSDFFRNATVDKENESVTFTKGDYFVSFDLENLEIEVGTKLFATPLNQSELEFIAERSDYEMYLRNFLKMWDAYQNGEIDYKSIIDTYSEVEFNRPASFFLSLKMKSKLKHYASSVEEKLDKFEIKRIQLKKKKEEYELNKDNFIQFTSEVSKDLKLFEEEDWKVHYNEKGDLTYND